MKKILFIICCFNFFLSLGQETESRSPQKEALDSLYREDQFYVGVTYNLLFNRATDIDQSDFSGGIHMGFTRDMPINKRRNVALALGVGYSVNVYNNNLFISEEQDTEQSIFSSLKGEDFSINRFTTHLVEAPLEFRWRTSTPESHKFYRIYAGLRIGYLYHFKSSFKASNITVRQTKVDELNRWRYGATFTFGWNTFNFHFYYGLNTLFDDNATIEGENIGLNPAKVGLIFYIL